MGPTPAPNWSSPEAITGLVLAALLLLALGMLGLLDRRLLTVCELLQVPLALLSDAGLFALFRRLADALRQLAAQPDPLLRELATLKLTGITEEAESLARGTVIFPATETWRTAYEKLLRTLKVQSYFSAAWVRTSDYWNDPPGRRSMGLNYELAEQGLLIDRIHILSEELWPFDEEHPSPVIRPWLEEQQRRGIRVRVAREGEVGTEPELLQDFAIYGDRATGVQELDEHSRTVRFILSFDRHALKQALDRWDRLSLYAVPWTVAGTRIRAG